MAKCTSPTESCKLCISLKELQFDSLLKSISLASSQCDLIEVRLDGLKDLKTADLSLLKLVHCSLILTLRKGSHGGDFHGSEAERFDLLRSAIALAKPTFVDIEADTEETIVRELQRSFPETKWIISWHEMKETPDDLETLFAKVSSLPGTYYKIATLARSTCDAARMLAFTHRINRDESRLCGICMGEQGQITRILSPLTGQPFTFASMDQGRETALGQLSAQEMVEIYRFRSLSRHSRIVGLIGNPVDKSYSHITHNAVLKTLFLDAVYVKFKLEEEEVFPFFEAIAPLPILGFSVTMPYKEKVLALLDEVNGLSSCNTLLRDGQRWRGVNTDGIGALRALGLPDYKKAKIIILGAGGTAKAIAAAAVKQGAEVTILNRTVDRAEAVAAPLGVKWGSLDSFPALVKEGEACLIQATSVGMAPAAGEMPIPPDWIGVGIKALDVVSNPSETLFLQEIKKKGGSAIGGKELFIHQAVEQFVYWFGPHLSKNLTEETLRNHFPASCASSSYSLRKSSLSGRVSLPPSKSHTIRAILLAAFVEGTSLLHHLLDSPDAECAIQAARQLGARINATSTGLAIEGVGGIPATPADIIDVGNSGQVLRFGGALAALGDRYTVLTGDESIRSNRPIEPLIEGLNGLGGWAVSTRGNGYAPLVVKGPLRGGSVSLDGADSQPVSALLMAGAFVEGRTIIQVRNSGEKPWLALTLSWLDRLGVDYIQRDLEYFEVLGRRIRPAFEVTIPGDLSALAFPIAAALITGSEIVIDQVDLSDVQGDKVIVSILEEMGACFEIDPAARTLKVLAKSRLRGRAIDVNNVIDSVPILAVLGCYAEGETVLSNGAIARKKECDRLSCMAVELKKLGALIEETDDGLKVRHSSLKGERVSSHGDHRVAMSLIIAGLGAEGETVVDGIECIKKSYPSFIQDLNRLRKT